MDRWSRWTVRVMVFGSPEIPGMIIMEIGKLMKMKLAGSFGSYFNFLQHTPGIDDDLDGIIDECYPGFWGENFQGDVGWNFLTLSEMEISGGGYVMNCYGICPENSSIWYDESCETDISLFINSEISGDTEDWRYYQNQPFDYKEIEVSQNVFYDIWPPPDNNFDQNIDIIKDCGQDGYCWDYNGNQAQQHAVDIWGNYVI